VRGSLRVSAGQDANTVIVAGPSELLAIVAEIVKAPRRGHARGHLDRPHLPLKNADANDVAATMTKMFAAVNAARASARHRRSRQARPDVRRRCPRQRPPHPRRRLDFAVIEPLVKQLDEKGEVREGVEDLRPQIRERR